MEIDQRETKKEEEGTKKEEEKKRDVRKICMKRTGEIVPFNYKKIEQAVAKAIHVLFFSLFSFSFFFFPFLSFSFLSIQ